MKAIRIILLVLIVIGVALMLTEDRWVPKAVNAILKSEGYSVAAPAPAADASTPGVSCFDSPEYFAIQKDNADAPGSDIVIKKKSASDQQIACAYSAAPGDFELKNLEAEYFLAFAGNFALIDGGTGPEPRGLTVYGISSRKQVFADQYAKPVTEEGNVISYWSPSAEKATAANCPDIAQNASEGLQSIIELRVSVDLSVSAPVKKPTGEARCALSQ